MIFRGAKYRRRKTTMAFYREWANQIQGYNRNIKLALLGTVFIQIGMGIFMVIYNFYIRELGFSEEVNGQIISMNSLATALILIPAGLLSDRIGRKKVMLFGGVLAGLVLIVRSITEVHSILILAAFFTGLAMAFVMVSGIPLLAENSTQSQRVHLFSIQAAIMTGSNVIGNVLGGTLTDLFSIQFSEVHSIRFTLLIGAVIFLLGIIPISKLKEKPREKTKRMEKSHFKSQAQNYKLVVLFAIPSLLIGFGAGLVIPYLNLYFSDRFAASTTTIGFIISLGQAATAIAIIIGPAVVKKVGEVRAVVILQLLSLPFLLLTAYTEHLWLAAIGFLFRQALMNAGNPIQSSLMMSMVGDSVKGLANSVNQMVFNLGWALMGPVSTGIVIKYGTYWGYATVFTITASLYLIGSVYYYVVFSKIRGEKRLQTAV
jgi:MFS family permease